MSIEIRKKQVEKETIFLVSSSGQTTVTIYGPIEENKIYRILQVNGAKNIKCPANTWIEYEYPVLRFLNDEDGFGDTEHNESGGNVNSVNGNSGDVILTADNIEYNTGVSLKTKIDTKVDTVNGETGSVTVDGSNISTSSGILNDALTQLSSDISDNTDDISNLQPKVASNETKVTQNEVNINSNTSSIIGVTDRVTTLENTNNPLLQDLNNQKKHRIASTFIKAENTNIVLNEEEGIRLSSLNLFDLSTESFAVESGTSWKKNDGTPFTSFFTSGPNQYIQFPDIEETDKSFLNDLSLARTLMNNALTVRLFGFFSETDRPGSINVEYHELDASGNLNTPDSPISNLPYTQERRLSFKNKGQSLTSRLSKNFSLLIQNGADLRIVNLGRAGQLIITKISLVFTLEG